MSLDAAFGDGYSDGGNDHGYGDGDGASDDASLVVVLVIYDAEHGYRLAMPLLALWLRERLS